MATKETEAKLHFEYMRQGDIRLRAIEYPPYGYDDEDLVTSDGRYAIALHAVE